MRKGGPEGLHGLHVRIEYQDSGRVHDPQIVPIDVPVHTDAQFARSGRPGGWWGKQDREAKQDHPDAANDVVSVLRLY
ncbi:MAG: hypothetical protein ACYDAG_00505 [Chloroflexota bacterium]